jgi:ribosomal protein S18 acetylase RimI-like enzyme
MSTSEPILSFTTRQAGLAETTTALILLKSAAATLQQKGIDQWGIWLNPPADKIKWVEEGFANGEFYFILIENRVAGMYRLLTSDELYWGPQEVNARYIHSLVVLNEFSGQQIGRRVLEQQITAAREAGIPLFRLDCNAANKALCSYYEQLGFRQVGVKQMPHSLNCLYELELL